MTNAQENKIFQPAIALRKTFRDGYGRSELRADLLAGLTVGIVALPLSMALAIAVGAPPQNGLFTAIVAGAVIAVLGGSRVQVSGPTAAFVVVLEPITAKFGLGGLLIATAMAGLILIVMSMAHLGRLIEFVPYPVTAGFTAGIGIVIATLQMRDFLGLEIAALPEGTLGKFATLFQALPTFRPVELALGLLTLALLVLWPRLNSKIPAPLAALTLVTGLAFLLVALEPNLKIATIDSKFGGIPRLPPLPILPWQMPGPEGAPIGLSFELIKALLPAAFAIALLGAIESLLSAVIADGMIRRFHDPDAELFGQGIGNLVGPFFGGIAATGAIARTATNVRSGGRSPIAAVVHSLFLLGAILAFAPLLGYLPLAALAALLLTVAWRMAEIPDVLHSMRTAPRSDAAVLLICLFLTVVFDMVVAVGFGVVMASLLFMRGMAEVSEMTLVAEPHRRLAHELPASVLLYEIAGPLFFGAAARAMRVLATVDSGVQAVILDLRNVPVLDATGLVSLGAAVERLKSNGIYVALGGVEGQPRRALLKAGWRNRAGEIGIFRSFDKAVEWAKTKGVGSVAASEAVSDEGPNS